MNRFMILGLMWCALWALTFKVTTMTHWWTPLFYVQCLLMLIQGYFASVCFKKWLVK